NDENGRNYHRIERSYGKFHRAFRLPRTVDSSKISAKFTDGLLELNVPKAEEAKPKTIDIKVK
ncbi:MAG: Hsp20/alpha crystallin family protein, partial [Bacteroidota bacterium]